MNPLSRTPEVNSETNPLSRTPEVNSEKTDPLQEHDLGYALTYPAGHTTVAVLECRPEALERESQSTE